MAPRSASQLLSCSWLSTRPAPKTGHQMALTTVFDNPLLHPQQDRRRAGELSNVCTPPSGPSPPAAAGRWPGGRLDRNAPEGPRVRPLGRGVTVAGVSGAPASGANLTPAPLPLLSCRAAMEAVEGARSVSMLAGAPVTRGCPAPRDWQPLVAGWRPGKCCAGHAAATSIAGRFMGGAPAEAPEVPRCPPARLPTACLSLPAPAALQSSSA